MKKQTNPSIKAHLLRGAFYLLLLVAVCVIPFALGQRTTTKQSAVANPLLLGSASVSTQSSSDAPFTFDNTGSLATARSEHTTALLALAAAPARNQIEQKPACAGIALQTAHRRATMSESSAARKRTKSRKSARIEISASHQRVGGREIVGFSARQEGTAREENLIPPAGLKPVEQEAWLAMARRQEASGGMGFTSFYPARYNEPFVVQGEGVRVAVRPVGGTDVKAHIDNNGQVIYRGAYLETDSVHAVSAGRSEEFLFLQDDCAPREFEYELSELSAGTRVELVKGEVHFSNKAGQGVKIEAPWLIEATGEQRAGAVRWE